MTEQQVSGWREHTDRLVAARPGQLKSVFREIHDSAHSEAARLEPATGSVVAAFSGNIHDDNNGPGPKVGPEIALCDVVLTERDLLILGFEPQLREVALTRLKLDDIEAVDGGLARGTLFKKFYAIRIRDHGGEQDAESWNVVSPLRKEDGPQILRMIRESVAAVHDSR